jgi:hypothetical protein
MADIFSQFLNKLTGEYDPSREPPKSILLSSQVSIQFIINDKLFYLFDIDSISKTLNVNEKKKFKPFGYTHPITLTNIAGWDIRIAGKKADDGVLEEFIETIIELNNNNQNIYPKNSQPYGANPTINLVESILRYNGESEVMEEYIYKDLVLTGYDIETPEDDSPITYTMSFYAPRRQPGNVRTFTEVRDDMPKSVEENYSYKYIGPKTKK